MVGIGEGRGRGGREVVGNEREERWLVRGGKREEEGSGREEKRRGLEKRVGGGKIGRT